MSATCCEIPSNISTMVNTGIPPVLQIRIESSVNPGKNPDPDPTPDISVDKPLWHKAEPDKKSRSNYEYGSQVLLNMLNKENTVFQVLKC